MISERKSSGEQATRRWSNGSIRAARRKHQKKSNVGAEEVEASSLYHHPEKREFFSEEVKKLGLDPAKITTFEWLEIDDRVSHAQQAA